MANLVHHVAGVCNALDGEACVRHSVDSGAGLARQLQQAVPGGGQPPALLGRKLDEVVALPARTARPPPAAHRHPRRAIHITLTGPIDFFTSLFFCFFIFV